MNYLNIMKMGNIFAYTNYRTFLKDYYAYQKKHTRFFSFRYFSKKAGCNSPSWLKFIIEGKRNLAEEGIDRFANALNLKHKEAQYFATLVHFNQATTENARNRYFSEMMGIAPRRKCVQLESAQFEYYSSWYHSIIRALTEMDDFNENDEWIAKRLEPAIKPSEAKASLKLLQTIGLVKRNAKGRLTPCDTTITSGYDASSLALRNFHRQMIKLAGESIERFPKEKREVSSLTIGVSDSCFMQIKESIRVFQESLMEMIARDKEKTRNIYQLNFQLFPVLKNVGGA